MDIFKKNPQGKILIKAIVLTNTSAQVSQIPVLETCSTVPICCLDSWLWEP